MKFGFMTWVCPDWDVPTIIRKAHAYGYDGVEFRVECNHKHGVELDAPSEHLLWVKRACSEGGIEIPCIATSQSFSSNDSHKRREQIELAKRYVELAALIGAPCIRVFGGPIPEKVSREDASLYVAESVREVGEFAEVYDVIVGLETHDSFSCGKDAAKVIHIAAHSNVRCVWDIMHPITHGETMEQAFGYVKPYVVHCHIHDCVMTNGNVQLTLLGEGIIDHFTAMRLLHNINFGGYLSGEFINFMTPDEILPQYANVLRKYRATLYG